MSRSIEAAVVLTISLLSSLSIVAYEVPFLKAVQGEAKQLKVINAYQAKSQDLYQVKTEINSFRQKSEATPYVSANPQKALEAIKLAEDLFHIKERRRTETNAPIDLPALPPGQVLPNLPGAPTYPALPSPSQYPGLPSPSQYPGLPEPGLPTLAQGQES